jgi:hypothetical protein
LLPAFGDAILMGRVNTNTTDVSEAQYAPSIASLLPSATLLSATR